MVKLGLVLSDVRFSYNMVTRGFCVYLILSALATSSFGASVAVPDVWPDVDDGFLSRSFLQTPGFGGIGPIVPFPIWNLIDLQSSFDLRLMNSSWGGPAETNIYQKGDSVHLQVSGSSATDQELFIQSCYVTSSSNPMDDSRSALILNNGCVSSKQSAIEFISRQHDSINLLLNTSRLMFSQEEQPEDPSNSSHVESFIGINQSGSGRFPSSMERGWIVASATMSDGFKMNVPYSSPWLSQPVASDGVMVINQEPGNALSVWLPGLSLDVAHNPVLELLIDLPQQKSPSRLVGFSSQGGAPSEGHVKNPSGEKNLKAHDWKSKIPERVSEVYMGDSPGLRNDWDLEGFPLPEEELRGDVFVNYKWPQQHALPDEKVREDSLASPLLEKPEEKGEEIKVLKQKEKAFKEVKGDDFGALEYMKKTMLTFHQASDGSSSLSYEEEERSPSVGEQKVKKSKLEMDRRKVDEKGSSKEVEKDLMQSVLDVVR
ncbi:hypothetical protein Baya_12393 [Bagarius yarrelli]|uniref:ZP-C domain-containing protein n=1 Tax=Bagarius yarrelli TaxID=175774 RepID=A0A556V2V3_BAGYA|nr:hypothetical protein Baya_12393 [Bagarius yarrelli]